MYTLSLLIIHNMYFCDCQQLKSLQYYLRIYFYFFNSKIFCYNIYVLFIRVVSGHDSGTSRDVVGEYIEWSYIQHSDNRNQPARGFVSSVQWRCGVAHENTMLRPGQARVVHKERLPIGNGPTSYGLQRYSERAQKSSQVIKRHNKILKFVLCEP